MSNEWPVREVPLTRYTLSADQYASKAFAEQYRVDKREDEMLGGLRYSLVQYVWGEELKRQEVRYPADWWQAVKARWFPEWAKQRWPVRYTVEVMEARALYPLVSMPHQEHVINILRYRL